MRIPFVLLCVVLHTSSAAADRATELAALIDADSAIVARLQPRELFELAKLGERMGGAPGAITGGGKAALKHVAGHDLLTAAGYSAAGFDRKRPAWLGIAAIDGKRAESVFTRLNGAREWTPKFLRKTPKPMWRSRLVVPISNKRKARRTLVAALSKVTEMHASRPANYERVALLFGDRPRNGAPIIKTLNRHGVVAAGWLEGLDSYLILRVAPRHAVIELVSPFAGVPITWQRDRRKLLRTLVPLGRRRGGFRARMKNGAAAALRAKGVRLWTSSSSSATALLAMARTEALRRTAARLPQSPSQRRAANLPPDPDCKGLRQLAERGQIKDVAVGLLWKKSSISIEMSWHLRSNGNWLLQSLAKPREKLPTAAGVMGAALFTKRLDRWAKLWKPVPLRRGFSSGVLSLTRCPGGSLSVLALTAWPELAASFIADLGSVNPSSRKILEELGPSNLVARHVTSTARDSFAVFEARIGAAAPVVAGLFDSIFGNERTRRESRLWGQGPIRAFLREDRGGFSVGKRALSWYSNLPRNMSPPKSGTILLARAKLGDLFTGLAKDMPSLGSVARAVTKRFGQATLELSAASGGAAGAVVKGTLNVEVR